MTAIDKLRALHTILWHARDEAGNKRLKHNLSEAIKIVEDLITGSEKANELVNLLTKGEVSLPGFEQKSRKG